MRKKFICNLNYIISLEIFIDIQAVRQVIAFYRDNGVLCVLLAYLKYVLLKLF